MSVRRASRALTRAPSCPLHAVGAGRRFVRLAPLVAAVLVGCSVDSVAPPQEVAWSAEIFPLPTEDPENTPDFSANVAMIARSAETEISIGIADAEPGTVFGWSVRSGTCAGTGLPLSTEAGAFPTLTADELGEDDALLVLDRRVSPNASYAAEVFADPVGGGGDLLGCSDLVELD